jgi:hypothetical protein
MAFGCWLLLLAVGCVLVVVVAVLASYQTMQEPVANTRCLYGGRRPPDLPNAAAGPAQWSFFLNHYFTP